MSKATPGGTRVALGWHKLRQLGSSGPLFGLLVLLVLLFFLFLVLAFLAALVLVVDLLADHVAARIDLDLPVLPARHHVRLVNRLPVLHLLVPSLDRPAARLAHQRLADRPGDLIDG